ncbi:MAG: phycobilisome rod-core linker polypeptide [Cyanobacteria bacterium P01_G01_bin.49]
MTIPLLNYPLSTSNQRVNGFEIPGDEVPKIYSLDNVPKGAEIDEIIWTCYRQIFNEQQIIAFNRQICLESQLKNGQITIRDFIRGLLLSDSFRRLNYETNNNYRFVEMCLQRVLGRSAYNNQETLAWSIIIATQGLQGFVDQLLNSDEYLRHFGDYIVPYQRRRILPQQTLGELPLARMARYDAHHLTQLQTSGQLKPLVRKIVDRSASVYRKVILIVPAASVALLIATVILVVTS